ncbi:YebC/PmpR family DNA-binding transcriptional regulator [Chloroflexota bacterium]
MSGHSKWSKIKHQKVTTDARRGQLFTKLTREIIVAVRQGGSDPEANYRLRLAIQVARDSNMPMDNIDRAIKKGSGETEGTNLVELTIEGYGPGGAAILVQGFTDNRNRTVQDIRNIFSRHGGSLGTSGSVAWLFESKGLIVVKTHNIGDEDLTLHAIDTGADDIKIEKDYVEIYTTPDQLMMVRNALIQRDVLVDTAQLVMISKTPISLDEKTSIQTLKLLDKLEELDEVQYVTSNVDFTDSTLEKYRAGISA